ncbi:hypothetical protein B4065_0305 [Caldibacillus thermoamylovorans]|nr:hypothetical protein B4065_0305 [Caldibacillus thermoamylovorans]
MKTKRTGEVARFFFTLIIKKRFKRICHNPERQWYQIH